MEDKQEYNVPQKKQENKVSVTIDVNFCNQIDDKLMANKRINEVNHITNKCYKNGNAEDIQDGTERYPCEVSDTKTRQPSFLVKDLLVDTLKFLELRSENPRTITGVPTGYHELDQITAGLQPSDLIIVAGSPSMGKTAFALNIMLHATIYADKKSSAIIFSLEMSKEQLMQRILCSMAHVDARRFHTGKLESEKCDWPRLTMAAGSLGEALIHIDDTPAISMPEIRIKSRHLKAKHGLDLIIIDFLQLMSARHREKRQEELSEITRSLKALAKELKLPIVLLSQLNRSYEDRAHTPPSIADLNSLSTIEQDADVILFIYREDCNDPACKFPHSDSTRIIVSKQRNGTTGTVYLNFQENIHTFENQPTLYS